MAAASCDWVISHSDRPRYVVCAEDIRFVYLFRGYVSATDVLRAHDYAILMRVGCLECVLTYSFCILTSLFFFLLSSCSPCLCQSSYFYGTYYSYNTISLFFVCCKTFLISADGSVCQCQEPKPPWTKCTFCRLYLSVDVISAAIVVIIV